MLGGGERESGRALDRSLIIECDDQAQPCAVANPAGASRLQSLRPVRRVAELGSLGRSTMYTGFDITPTVTRYCAGPLERVRIVSRFEDLRLTQIRRGIVYILAAWSGPSVIHCLASTGHAWSSTLWTLSACPTTLCRRRFSAVRPLALARLFGFATAMLSHRFSRMLAPRSRRSL
jgi:hypothetical protein